MKISTKIIWQNQNMVTIVLFQPSFTDIDFRDCIICGQQQACHVLPVLRGSQCQLDICYAPQIAPFPLTQKASNLKIQRHKTNMLPHASTKSLLMEQIQLESRGDNIILWGWHGEEILSLTLFKLRARKPRSWSCGG